MIVRVELLRRADGLSQEAFRSHWLGPVSGRSTQVPGLIRHEQNHVIDRVQRGIDYKRGPEQFDAFSMYWFDDEAAMQAAMASCAWQALAEVAASHLDSQRVLLIDQHEVIAPEADRLLIKRMSTLRRRDDVSPQVFRNEWRDVHARLVQRIPRVRGYRQDHVLGREAPAGSTVSHATWPIDGIVELWFDDADSLNAAFASPQGATLMMHAREFIAEITTFLVECHVIVDGGEPRSARRAA